MFSLRKPRARRPPKNLPQIARDEPLAGYRNPQHADRQFVAAAAPATGRCCRRTAQPNGPVCVIEAMGCSSGAVVIVVAVQPGVRDRPAAGYVTAPLASAKSTQSLM